MTAKLERQLADSLLWSCVLSLTLGGASLRSGARGLPAVVGLAREPEGDAPGRWLYALLPPGGSARPTPDSLATALPCRRPARPILSTGSGRLLAAFACGARRSRAALWRRL